MEAFSLLKYWRTNTNAASDANARATTKTLVTAASLSSYSSDDDQEGPYFDIQFSLPNHDEEKICKNQINEENETSAETESSSSSIEEEEEEEDEEEEEEVVEEVKFTLATNEDDQNFFNEDMISSIEEEVSQDINSKFTVSLLKSATKFRVLLLKLKKSKSGNGILENEVVSPKSKIIQEKQNESVGTGKFCTVKFKVEEVKMPLISLFKRENSNNKEVNKNDTTAAAELDSDEKKLTKEVALQKYLKMVKPLYIRDSKRYLENLKFSGRGGVEITPAVKQGENLNTNQKQQQGNLQAGLKVVRKHLGKSRSASSTVTAASPPEKMGSNRRDDSLVEIHDGIQGAILHCKKSFNASRDGGESSSSSSCSSVLGRSTSDSKLIKEIKD